MFEERPLESNISNPYLHHIGRLALALELVAQQAIQAEHEATHDRLTGALNRRGLERYLETAVVPKALLLADVTNFKSINDKYGYEVGDQVICNTYENLSQSIRSNDVIARWGGDEFVVVLGGEPEQPNDMARMETRFDYVHTNYIELVKKRIGENMQQLLEKKPEFQELNIDLAIGGAVWPGNSSVEGLISEAEIEMKAHKAAQHRNDRLLVS